jgi:predicted nucleotidyltransferase
MRALKRPTAPPASPQLVEILFGAYRRRILSLLLLHPEQSFYVREIARLTDVPAGSLHRELKLLQDAGLLARSTAGNQVRYQADRACPIFEDLAGIFRKTAGLADVLREALAPLASAVRVAFVFGSVAQGKERIASDVDVLVLGSAGFAQVIGSLAPASERLRREINAVVMTVSAFGAKHAARDRFATRIAREPKIFLVGDAGEFAKLAEDRAA